MQMPETAGIPIALLAHHLRSSTVFALPPTPLCPLLPAYNICVAVPHRIFAIAT